MELDRALELAVVSSWDELVRPGESYSVHVEYKNVSKVPLNAVEVWMMKNRGYGCLAFRYSVAQSSAPLSGAPTIYFANSYSSKMLAENFDFIMRNQDRFSRPLDQSVHGLVQVDAPDEQDRVSAAAWRQSGRTDDLAARGALAHP